MLRQLVPPSCHWQQCSRFKKPMDLINEGESFYFFACGCGTTRAISKPSAREKSMLEKYDRDIEMIRRYQKIRDSRPDFSFPSRGVR